MTRTAETDPTAVFLILNRIIYLRGAHLSVRRRGRRFGC